ncbi:MAG: glycosyltransferase [Prevotella sp.]|nr:glycosyltransferase [Prevotella sp.]MCM1075321.1 glycosyltransferase [Ruminococcus sp.]
MIFSLAIDNISIYLLCAAFIFALAAAVIGLRHMRKVARYSKRMTSDTPADDNLPGMSVIVYTHNAEKHIETFLNTLLQQNHPEFEVIVVNDASIDNTREIVENMLESNPRLYLTFVSDTAKNISHRKLAYTIGLRAAKYPVALLTASNIEIPSDNWLRLMAAPFADKDIEIGLGAIRLPNDTDKGSGKYWRSFDTLSSDTRWLGAALLNHPYRGTAYNLAFRPDTFFENKGFASTNRFQNGEDDIFVNEISTSENTAVIFQPEAMPAIQFPPEEFTRLWKHNKERYTFTAKYLHTGALRTQGFMSLSVWGALLCAIAAAVIGLPNLLPVCAALLLMLLLWADQICVYRRAAAAMQTIKLWWSVPILWLIRPIANACYRADFQANKHTNYTWQQPH